MPVVRRIAMQNFRGSAHRSMIEFDAQRPIALIFGENGTGKSTIVDALDMVCNALPGSIAERSGTSAQKHLPAIGSAPAQVEVEIEFGNGDIWTGRLTDGGKVRVAGPSASPTVCILRRRSLLKLTESAPSERYGQLKRLIDVENVEKAEKRLADALNQTNTKLNETAQRLLQEQERLKTFRCGAGAPDTNLLTWAKAQAAIPRDDVQSRVGELEQCLDILRQLLHSETNAEQAKSMHEQAQQNLQKLEETMGSSTQELETSLVSLLEHAGQHLTRTAAVTDDTCPLCQQAVSTPELQAQIAQRLRLAEQVRIQNQERHAAQEAVHQAATRLGIRQQEYQQARLQFAGTGQDEPSVALLDHWKAELAGLRTTLEDQRGICASLHAHEEAEARGQELQRLKERLEAMLHTMRDTRRTFIQGIFDAVAAEAQRLYQVVHPREPLGLRGLQIDPERRASLHQVATFHGHDDILPQGFYSEAHLDTLGFCFWLAVVKYTTPNAIIVLDDVFTSVDAAHLSRIDDLLRTEVRTRRTPQAAFPQIIVVTHYRGWLDRLRNETPDSIEVKELLKWTLEHGIQVHNTLPHTAELKGKLQTPHLERDTVASKSGVMLERLLDDLTMTLQLDFPRVPRGEYTLDPLLRSASKAARRFVTQPPVPAAPQAWQPVLDRLNSMVFIRNQVGAHFSLGALDITDDDVRELAETTLALANLMTCPVCGGRTYRKKHDDGSYSCGGDCKKTHIRTA